MFKREDSDVLPEFVELCGGLEDTVIDRDW